MILRSGGYFLGRGILLIPFRQCQRHFTPWRFVKTTTKLRYIAAILAGSGLATVKMTYDDYYEKFKKMIELNPLSYLKNFFAIDLSQDSNNISDEKVVFNDDAGSNLSTDSSLKLNNVAQFLLDTGQKVISHADNTPNKSHERYDNPKCVERLDEALNKMIEMQRHFHTKYDRIEMENKRLRKALESKDPISLKKALGNFSERTLIDQYAEILQELSSLDSECSFQDNMPRIVVVGDQSSGKTSILEVIARVRLFPRGAGQMMTRTPVMVTLSEGEKHEARFHDSKLVYDLTNEKKLKELRKEIEARMKNAVKAGKTVSSEPISLFVQGPGLHKMILVDLPGLINTVTTEMSNDTKESILQMNKKYLSNPNAIILCVQDLSLDAEKSMVAEFVRSIDPEGQRTIGVFTKIDLAEKNHIDNSRLKNFISGSLFGMKTMGNFAVISGTGDPNESIDKINNYEDEYFKSSKLYKNGIVNPTQATSQNLSLAVSCCFWDMIRNAVERELERFRSHEFELETEWRNSFPGVRELTRNELFEKARTEILDHAAHLSSVPAAEWERLLLNKLWTAIVPHIFKNIYLPNALSGSSVSFKTQIDIMLQQFCDKKLEDISVRLSKEVMLHFMNEFFAKRAQNDQSYTSNFIDLITPLKDALLEEFKTEFTWGDYNLNSLNVIQDTAIGDTTIHDQSQWDTASTMFESILTMEGSALREELQKLIGPSKLQQYIHWKSKTPEQTVNDNVVKELKIILNSGDLRSNHLSDYHIDNVTRSLNAKGIKIKRESILKLWNILYLEKFFYNSCNEIQACRKQFHSRDFSRHPFQCNDIVLFWRVHRLILQSANTLRQQITTLEAKRFENFMNSKLESISSKPDLMQQLIHGKQVDLAEKLNQVSSIRKKLEIFVDALRRERTLNNNSIQSDQRDH